MTQRIWFITGISRGLGLALARAALQVGDQVIGTTRDGEAPEELACGRLTVLRLDLGDPAEIQPVVARAYAVHGRIDVLVNNAGYGLLGSIESASLDEARHVFDINFFGPLAVIGAALPLMRAQARGHILNISSIAAIAPNPGSGIYAAAKGALSVLSQCLAQETASLGLWVTSVAPGAFRTDFLSGHSIRRTRSDVDDYAATSGRTVDGLLARDGKQAGDPERAARAIIEAVEADEPPRDLLLGDDALQRTRSRLDRFENDVSRWEDVSRSTDFPLGT
jgi:NAD(P)-dependent dehydrogenase (short-subunit alcohol dehydrogenase family)